MNKYELLREKYIAFDEEVRPLVKDVNQREVGNDDKLAYPLLLKDWGYYEAEKRLMIFGQETNGWGDKGDCIYGDRDDTDVDVLLDRYFKFFNDGDVKHPGPFWNIVKQFVKVAREKYNGDQEDVQYLWNNLVKVGKQGIGRPDKHYGTVIKPHFNRLILTEIELLEPDYIVFFTGPDYDFVLNDVFGNPEKCVVDGFSEKELCELKLPCPNVKKAFRTYHPQFLSRNNPNRPYKEFLDRIVGEILET